MDEIKTEIYKRIAAINKEIGAIGKDQKNKQQNFNFRGIDSVYNSLHDLLAKHEVFTTSEIIEQSKEEKPTRNGGILIYRVFRIKYTFYTIDGSKISTEVIGEAMDPGDKAANKAMAIAHKYALLQIFTIPTEGDNDPDSNCHEPMQGMYNKKPNNQNSIKPDQDNNSEDNKSKLNLGKRICINLVNQIYATGPEKEKVIQEINKENNIVNLRKLRSKLMKDKGKIGAG